MGRSAVCSCVYLQKVAISVCHKAQTPAGMAAGYVK